MAARTDPAPRVHSRRLPSPLTKSRGQGPPTIRLLDVTLGSTDAGSLRSSFSADRGDARQSAQMSADECAMLLGHPPPTPQRPFWEPSAKYSYESLDYVEVESRALQDERAQRLSVPPKGLDKRLGDWKRWLLLSIIGALTGLTAFGIVKGIDGINDRKWQWVGSHMGSDTSSTIPFWPAFGIFAGTNLVLCTIAAAFVLLGEPLAAGSGIPEVKCYLNGVRVYRIARLRTFVAKAAGILFSVASGLPCGKEGPMIHSGAVIGGGVATGKSSKLHFDTGLFKEYRGDRDKRMFVAAGAAAGVAAAFGAPIGGVLFAVEEACTWWTLDMSVQIFFCATVSSATLNLCMKWNDPQTPASGLTNFGRLTESYTLVELPLCIVLGCLAGLLGALFNYLNIRLTELRRRVIRGVAWRRLVEVLAINALVSITLFTLTSRLYRCQPIEQLQSDEGDARPDYIRQWGCSSKGDYNDMATYFFSSTEESIKRQFHSGQAFAYSSLLSHLIPYFLLTVLTYGIAVPSGLFLPCLALGSSFGRLYAQGLHDIFSISGLHLGVYSCFGAAAVLAGVIRMTVSLSVIVMEASGNSTYIVPLMLITCCARFVGEQFNHGIYDLHIHFNRVPLMGDKIDNPRLACLRADRVMNRTDLAILSETPTCEEVLVALSSHEDHNGFIVTKDGTRDTPLSGLILRRCLMILIRRGAYGADAASLGIADFVKSAHERELLKVAKYAVLRVPTERLQDRMLLNRYMDAWPFSVLQDTPLPRVYSLFREMGLRHLVVVDEQRHPVGMICRKNLVHLQERVGGERRRDPADGQLKQRADFVDSVNWRQAHTDTEAFHVARHPSRQQLVTNPRIATVDMDCPRCGGSGRLWQWVRLRYNECPLCEGSAKLPEGSYWTVGQRSALRGDVFVDPHHDDGDLAEAAHRSLNHDYGWRLDHSAGVVVASPASPHASPGLRATMAGSLPSGQAGPYDRPSTPVTPAAGAGASV